MQIYPKGQKELTAWPLLANMAWNLVSGAQSGGSTTNLLLQDTLRHHIPVLVCWWLESIVPEALFEAL